MKANGYTLLGDLPGGFGEKLFVHNTIPGGPGVVGERVKQLLAERERERERAQRAKAAAHRGR